MSDKHLTEHRYEKLTWPEINDAIAATVKAGDQGTTFGGGMLAMAAVHATLRQLTDDGLMARSLALFDRIADGLRAVDGVTEVRTREAAVAKLELPGDRIGDLFVLSGRDWVIGRTPGHHDLAKLEGTLRSHGGRYEEMVPFLISEPLNAKYAGLAKGDPRNFDIFDFACNGTQP